MPHDDKMTDAVRYNFYLREGGIVNQTPQEAALIAVESGVFIPPGEQTFEMRPVIDENQRVTGLGAITTYGNPLDDRLTIDGEPYRLVRDDTAQVDEQGQTSWVAIGRDGYPVSEWSTVHERAAIANIIMDVCYPLDNGEVGGAIEAARQIVAKMSSHQEHGEPATMSIPNDLKNSMNEALEAKRKNDPLYQAILNQMAFFMPLTPEQAADLAYYVIETDRNVRAHKAYMEGLNRD